MKKRRDFFPGGNTGYGYHSFYEYLPPPDCQRRLIIKGGPGTGKSGLMQKVGERFAALGAELEYHWCSSDPQSLDGIAVRGQNGFCLLDGTSPHVVEPSCPGARDEIINTGSFWDAAALRRHRQEIERLNDDIGRCFRRAYLRLAEALLARQEYDSYYEAAGPETPLPQPLAALAAEYLSRCRPAAELPDGSRPCADGDGHRHLFAAAIGPEGVLSRLQRVIDGDTPIYAVQGAPGEEAQKLFALALQQAQQQNLRLEVLHCPLDPRRIDAVLQPDGPLLLNLSPTVADYAGELDAPALALKLELSSPSPSPAPAAALAARERCARSVEEAVPHFAAAKKLHDELEAIYIAAMDFDRLNTALAFLLNELQDYWG